MKVIMSFRKTEERKVKKILSILEGDAKMLQFIQGRIIHIMKKEGWELL